MSDATCADCGDVLVRSRRLRASGCFSCEHEARLKAEAAALSLQVRVNAIFEARGDDLTKQACDECEQCGQLVMCNYHSLLSELAGHVTLPLSLPVRVKELEAALKQAMDERGKEIDCRVANQDSVRRLSDRLERVQALIEQWREEAARHFHGSLTAFEDGGDAGAVECFTKQETLDRCADDLASLLAVLEAPPQTAQTDEAPRVEEGHTDGRQAP